MNDFSVTGDFGRPCEDKGLEQAGLPTDSFSRSSREVVRSLLVNIQKSVKVSETSDKLNSYLYRVLV